MLEKLIGTLTAKITFGRMNAYIQKTRIGFVIWKISGAVPQITVSY